MEPDRRFALLATAVTALAMSAFASAVPAEDLPYGLKPGKPYAGTKLTYLAPVAAQYDGHEARVKEFTDLTGIEVEFEFIPFRNLQERILAHKVAGDAEPDLVNYMDAWGPALKDMFMPIDAAMSEDGVSMDRYFGAHRQGATYDGTVYGLPLRGHAQLLFYRKDLLDKHGLDVPTTWDELVEVASIIKEREGLGIASYYTTNQAQNVDVWMNLVWSNGGELIRDGKAVFNSPEAVEALQFYSDLENEFGVNSEGAKSFDQYDASLSFASDKSAFVMVWWWHYGSRILGENTTLTADQVGFTGMPAYRDGDAVTFAMSMPTAINIDSDKQEAAWEFLKWVSNADLEKANVTDKSERNVIVALHRENMVDEEVNAANRGIQAAAAASLGSSRIFPQLDAWPEIKQLISNAISETVVNGVDPQESLDAAAEQAQKLLDRG